LGLFSCAYLNDLAGQAKNSTRLRQHRNIHQSYQDACQRLFNAIEPGSYIRPHRHASEPREELLIAIRGSMALVTFDDQGSVIGVLPFGSEKHGINLAVGAEVASSTWHTVVAFEPGCVLLEVKAGPFDPNQPKDLAPWAPEEGSEMAQCYLQGLAELAGKFTLPETAGA
jgi:cupin fold WbuC family metalloprotein